MPADTTFIVNDVLRFFIWFSVVTLVVIIGVMIFFVLRYHHRRNANPSDIRGNVTLEVIWIVVPTLLGVAMFFIGLSAFNGVTKDHTTDAMKVEVEAFEYGWEFEYPNGVTANVLRVPEGKEISLSISSRDVIHSFYAPAYRIKMDAVPGMTTHLRFDAHELGTFPVICAEYCGIGHSAMTSEIQVISPDEFSAWYTGEGGKVVAAE